MKPEGIDKLLNEKLGEYSISPRADLWSEIDGALEYRESRITNGRYKIAIAVAVLLLLGGVLNNYYYVSPVNHEEALVSAVDSHQQELPQTEKDPLTLDDDIIDSRQAERNIAYVNKLESMPRVKTFPNHHTSPTLIQTTPTYVARTTPPESTWKLELNISPEELMAMAQSTEEDSARDFKGIIKKTSNLLNEHTKLAQIDFLPGISIERRKK